MATDQQGRKPAARIYAHAIGRTILGASWATDEEREQLGFSGRGEPMPVLELDDGGAIYPLRDPEGNGPGWLMVEPGAGTPPVDVHGNGQFAWVLHALRQLDDAVRGELHALEVQEASNRARVLLELWDRGELPQACPHCGESLTGGRG